MTELPAQLLQRMKAATVDLPGKGGRGVIMQGELILTAVHCLESIAANSFLSAVIGDNPVESLVAADGARFRARVLAADVVSDLAVLGALDAQDAWEQAELFESVVRSVEGLTLRTGPFSDLSSEEAWVRTADGNLMSVKLDLHLRSEVGVCFATSATGVDKGSSGGPVVDASGRLLGVVSMNISTPLNANFGWPVTIASEALPQWALTTIQNRHDSA